MALTDKLGKQTRKPIGLFDTPENVAKMLSPTYMREQLAAAVAGGTTSTTKEVGG